MKYHHILAALAAASLLLGPSLSMAAEGEAGGAGESAAKVAPKNAKAHKEIEARRKANAKIKPVDINTAKKEQLMKLPGIGAAEAERIIAGRPYGSKYWLVTKNIIPEGLFHNISLQIEAKQPFKDGDKNAEIYRKLNEQKPSGQTAGDKKTDDKKK